MSEALEHLRKHNRHEVALADGGIVVGYHLPDVQECLLAGDIPLPVLQELPTNPKESDVTAALEAVDPTATAKAMFAFKRRIVAAMVDDIDGNPVPDDERLAIAEAFSPAQRDELADIAQRKKDPALGEA